MTSVADPLVRAKSLAPLIEAQAEETSRQGRFTDAVDAAFRESELFWMNLPAELGGEDIEMQQRFDVYEELARADGSTGWSFMTISGFVGYSAVGLADDAVKTMYGDPAARGLAAGFLGPSGTMVDVDGGYRLKGSYRFGSGVPRASWVAAGAFVDGRAGEIVTAFVPFDEITPGPWSSIGLEGTGSIDYDIADSYVPESFTFKPLEYRAQRGGLGGRLDLSSSAMAYHSAVAMGIAKRALEEITVIADLGKQRPPFAKTLDQQMFLHDFVLKEGRLRATRALMCENIELGRAAVDRGDPLDDLLRARFRQTANQAQLVATEVTSFAYYWGGSQSIRRPTALGRCMLDITVANQHATLDHNNVVDVAPSVIAHYRRS